MEITIGSFSPTFIEKNMGICIVTGDIAAWEDTSREYHAEARGPPTWPTFMEVELAVASKKALLN
jgi:hypothetical protein